MKFNPSYLLSAETQVPAIKGGNANVKIELPMAIDFEINRQTAASTQTGIFRMKNLGETTRDLLQKDWFTLSDVRAIQFSAGYAGSPLTMIFNGTIKQAQSYKESGSDDFITEIEAFDGGATMANGVSVRNVASGAQFTDLIKNLAKDLPGTSADVIIGKIEGVTARGSSFCGNTWNYIFQLTDGLAFIDNGQLKVLKPNEYCGQSIPVISSQSGLLGSPRRFHNMMKVSVLFEPQFTLGQLIDLQSSILKQFNGQYKVMGIIHRGTIALEGPGGERRTELTLWNGLGNAETWQQVA